jgi:hypothetical protein
MHAAIRELVPDAEFSIFTGDIVDHAMWSTSVEYNEFSSTFPTFVPQIHTAYRNMPAHAPKMRHHSSKSDILFTS